MSVIETVKRLRSHKKGNVLAMAAIAMPVLVGAGGLATDTIQWTLWKRQLQREADSAALAGTYALAQNANVTTAATTEVSRSNLVPLSTTPVVENAPTAGAYAGNSNAVRVVLQTTQTLPFSSMFMRSPPVISAEATASLIQNGNYCVISLESTTATGVTMQGNASVDMGCGIVTNSQAANAVYAGGSSQIHATPVAAVGGLSSSSNYIGDTTLQPYSIPQPDPFASLSNPTLPSCSGKLNVNPTSTVDVSNSTGEKCYRGMDIKGTVHLDPGIYYIDGGEFSVGSQGVVTGTDVTIVLTSSSASTNPSSIATIDINGGATVQLTAPDSGTYKDILFYQDRRALDSGTNQINGNASSNLQGAIYMPKQAVSFSGDSGMVTDCVQIVSRRVTFIGNNNISNNCPAGYDQDDFKGLVVRLVG